MAMPNQYQDQYSYSFTVPLPEPDRYAARNRCKLYAQRLRSQLMEMLPDYSVKPVVWAEGQTQFQDAWYISAYRGNFCGYQVSLTLDLNSQTDPVVVVGHDSREKEYAIGLTGIIFFTIALFGKIQFYKISGWLLYPAALLLAIALGGGLTWLFFYQSKKIESLSEKSLSAVGQWLERVPM